MLSDEVCRKLLALGNSREPILISHLEESSIPGVQAFLGVPIVLEDGVLYGTLGAVDSQPYPFQDRDVAIMESLARLLAKSVLQDRAFTHHQTLSNQIDIMCDHMTDIISVMDREGILEYASPSHVTVLGFAADEFIGKSVFEFVHPNELSSIKSEFYDLLVTKHTRMLEMRFRTKTGWIDMEVTGSPILDKTGQITHVIAIGRDISERKLSKQLLEESEQRYRSLFDHHPDAIFSLDLEGRLVTLNESCGTVTGMTREELEYLPFLEVVASEHRELAWQKFLEAKSGLTTGAYELSILNVRGEKVDVQASKLPIFVNGEVVGVYGTIKNVTAFNQMQTELKRMAYYDDLTGLPNRRFMVQEIGKSIERAGQNGTLTALLYLDIDRFKNINDSFGHAFGDRFLQAVAERLQQCCAESGLFVARVVGDEFTILLSNQSSYTSILDTVSYLLHCIGRQFLIEGKELFMTPSVGIAIYPLHALDADTLLKNADSAVHTAKITRHQVEIYRQSDRDPAELYSLEKDLRVAVANREFVLYYQPKVDIQQGSITSVEALIRWIHPQRGMVSPADFIPLAEDTGLIPQIGDIALEIACLQAKAWLEAGTPLRVAVNVSALQFHQGDYVEQVVDKLRQTGLPPELLELEITESVVMKDVERVKQTMQELHQLGISISIDDFGTGYSSLQYLNLFPIQSLKIDRSFVQSIDSQADRAPIVTTIIAMAQTLGMEVIAEGVETEEQVDFLFKHGCNLVQGFIYFRPMPADQVLEQIMNTQKS
ncbi:EAL domain-containing protein [Tumebacillus sp. ITR2]|uniref:EAL domain-containing protein n=1 Tax=Tumebacillus amylolyticus TaxID=2801339 RepID=A0ABS1J6K9_9BACL|nr:bifunctional diguanylate cyclase/phosphodiesterase [Tumebacillus amylolyticus]MBL0385889.1 EAL domain-containing protein [Tumebacillus amylolyticus]